LSGQFATWQWEEGNRPGFGGKCAGIGSLTGHGGGSFMVSSKSINGCWLMKMRDRNSSIMAGIERNHKLPLPTW